MNKERISELTFQITVSVIGVALIWCVSKLLEGKML